MSTWRPIRRTPAWLAWMPGWLRLTLKCVLWTGVVCAALGLMVVLGGVNIIAVVDKRQVLMADPSNAILSLKQLTKAIPAGMSEAEARKIAADMQAKTRNMGGCGKADEVAKSLGAEVVSNDQLRMGDLPQQLQQILQQMPIGAATPAFGSPQDGLRVLVLSMPSPCAQSRRSSGPNFLSMGSISAWRFA